MSPLRRASLFIVILQLLVAGCLGGDAPASEAAKGAGQDAGGDLAGAETSENNGTETAQPPPASTPAQAGETTEDSGNLTAPPPPVLIEDQSRFLLGVGAPCAEGGCFTGAMAAYAILDTPEGNPTRATLEVTWEATTPAATSAAIDLFRVVNNQAESIVEATGTSPLVVEVPVENLQGSQLVRGFAAPDTPGAFVDQPATFKLILHYD